MDAAGRGDRIARWLVVPLAVTLVVVLGVFYGLFRTVQVSGPSMEPTLLDQDRLLVTRGYNRAVRGDIVVVSEALAGDSRYEVIKRVAAVPGDTFEVRSDGVFVNGVLDEPPGGGVGGNADAEIQPTTLADGQVYLLGDNRPVSLDSRSYGPVRMNQIEGRAVFIFSPLNRVSRVR